MGDLTHGPPKKLDLRSRVEAAVWAVQEGIDR